MFTVLDCLVNTIFKYIIQSVRLFTVDGYAVLSNHAALGFSSNTVTITRSGIGKMPTYP